MIQESIERMAELDIPENPFPGLRPFEFHENYLFFGREGQSERVIEKLASTHFIAVVGTSGSGKSSLVRAGLLPALIGGMMSKAGSAWRVALMRPGNDPLGSLARALNSRDAFGSEDEENLSLQIALTEATLRRGNRGLVEIVRQANMPSRENLIVIADQFEELFRVGQDARKQDADNDKAAFVKLLLEASRQRELSIYVVLTMRSDYLGDCAQFWDLPEAINEGQYLIPRLTLDQRREAIIGPVEMAGARIAPRLVNRLINDVGDNPDQLPILQHALMRAWDKWKEENRAEEPVDLRHYEAIGGMAEALSRHADEAYNELPDELRKVAEKVFKALTEKGSDNREIRNQISLREICAIADAQGPEIIAVLEPFRRQGRSFLMPPADTPLSADSLIDISHESLIRVWKRLKEWVDEEARSARQYQRLAETAMLREAGEAALWRDPDLQAALNWRKRNRPNPAWARRYQPALSNALSGLAANDRGLEPEAAFDRALRFLEDSEKQRAAEIERQAEQQRIEEARKQRELNQAQALAEEQRQRAEAKAKSATILRWVAGGLILLFLLAIYAARYAINQKRVAEQTKNEAVEKEKTVRQLLYISDIGLAKKTFDEKNRTRGYELMDSYFPTTEFPDDMRSFAWYYLWGLNHKELAMLNAHANFVLSVAFSPDGKILASGGGDNTIKLWDATTGKWLNTLSGHSKPVSSVAFSPDGKLLVSSSWDTTIKLWDVSDVSTGVYLNTLQTDYTEGDRPSVVFSPDGKMLASGNGDHTIKLWDASTGKLLNTFQAGQASFVAFSPDGKMLVSDGESNTEDKTIELRDANTGKLLKTLPGRLSYDSLVVFSPDGKLLASNGRGGTIKLWDATTGKSLNSLQTSDVNSIAFSPDGKVLASDGADHTIKLWDATTGKLLNNLQGHSNFVLSVAFSPDGKVLASGGADRAIKLWNVGKQESLNADNPLALQNSPPSTLSVAFSPDSKVLASGDGVDTIKLWDASTGMLLNTLQESLVLSVAFSPDGEMLASGGAGDTIKLWNASTGKLLNTLEGHVSSVAFSPDGKVLASASRNTIKLWDTGTGKLLNNLQGHSDFVTSVAFSPDGKTLASGSRDETIKLWDATTGKLLNNLQGHSDFVTSVAFSPDSALLASGSRDTLVNLWDTSTGKWLNSLRGHSSLVSSVAFSTDGKVLASGSGNEITLWDVDLGKMFYTIQSNSVTSLAFSPDGKRLASGSASGPIKLFFAATDQEAQAQKGN